MARRSPPSGASASTRTRSWSGSGPPTSPPPSPAATPSPAASPARSSISTLARETPLAGVLTAAGILAAALPDPAVLLSAAGDAGRDDHRRGAVAGRPARLRAHLALLQGRFRRHGRRRLLVDPAGRCRSGDHRRRWPLARAVPVADQPAPHGGRRAGARHGALPQRAAAPGRHQPGAAQHAGRREPLFRQRPRARGRDQRQVAADPSSSTSC